jgi:hypothetical protein
MINFLFKRVVGPQTELENLYVKLPKCNCIACRNAFHSLREQIGEARAQELDYYISKLTKAA